MRMLLFILLPLYFVSCSDHPKMDTQPEVAITKDATANQNKGDSLFSIIRTDNRNQRVFVVIDSNILADIKKIKAIIKQIDNKYKFRDDLNISFVSNPKYAGYKDELEENKGISYYEFYLNYLGEYNKDTKIFWIYPVLADRKVKYILD
ncbi:MAG: hypothetical protein HEQ40_06785 [Lacibacter sp.]|jgi:hypothetical protein